MKFKNLLALILALVMVFSAGCAPKAVEEPSTPAIEKTEPTEVNVIEEAAKAYFENKPENSYIVPIEDVVKKIDASEDIFLLDIRSAKDYELGHLVGAVNIPWGPEFATSVSNLPSDKPVYLYCVTGQTAGQTVALLNVLGYDATSIKLGWNLGISKMEGIDKYTETTVNEFGEVAKLEMNQ
jgi:rhodanese-related sulfurtransferase